MTNVFLLTVDEVRADDLSCYGQKKIETPEMDSLAENGVLYEECRAVAPYTPVCMGTLLSGTYPNKHGRRDAYRIFTPPMTLAEILKINGYKTAAWTSAELLVERYGYDAGFDEFHEPVKYLGMRPLFPEYDSLSDEEFNEKMLEIHTEAGALVPRDAGPVLQEVYWWIDEVLSWLKENKDEKFFVWCHFYESHVGIEEFLIFHKLIKEGENSENNYHLAKVDMVDRLIVKPLIETMQKLGLYDKTIMILQTDHGTHLAGRKGERPMPPLFFATKKGPYPSHNTLYDADVHVVNIWRGPGLPKGVNVKGQVRTVDTVPTLLELLGIEPPKIAELDGISLMPFVKTGKAEGLVAYIEHLHEGRVFGCQQALCDGRYKFIRSLVTGAEELYDLKYDPNEYVNLLNTSALPLRSIRETTVLEDYPTVEKLAEWRRELNKYLLQVPPPTRTIRKPKKELDEAGRREVDDRLRSLGYIR